MATNGHHFISSLPMLKATLNIVSVGLWRLRVKAVLKIKNVRLVADPKKNAHYNLLAFSYCWKRPTQMPLLIYSTIAKVYWG